MKKISRKLNFVMMWERDCRQNVFSGGFRGNRVLNHRVRTGWVDFTIIHEAQRIFKNINPLIEGFQRPPLGPRKNFDLLTSELIQIIHTGDNHWVCISPIGCQQGFVNVNGSLFNSVISKDIEEQCNNLLGDDFKKLSIVPVQQQNNGSDCGLWSFLPPVPHSLNRQYLSF